MKRVFISTTNNVDNGKVQEYYGVVSSHLVAGTGFLTDLAASFSDLFGGRSGSYRRELEELYEEALDEISEKARRMGANSILGLKIDLDNISGKGMSMFMITAVGTAAFTQFENEQPDNTPDTVINSTTLVNEIAKRAILKELEDKNADFPLKNWDIILQYPDREYVRPLTERYFAISVQQDGYDYFYEYREKYLRFIQLIDREYVIPAIYEGLRADPPTARRIISDYQLFDAKSILAILREGLFKTAVSVLGTEQPYYSETDLCDMEAILEELNKLPDLGKIEFVKGGMFGKDGQKYLCRYGHKNNPDSEFCSECGENIKGLTSSEVRAIDTFKNRVAVLKELLSESRNIL